MDITEQWFSRHKTNTAKNTDIITQ